MLIKVDDAFEPLFFDPLIFHVGHSSAHAFFILILIHSEPVSYVITVKGFHISIELGLIVLGP